MNNIDKQYQRLLQDIIHNGVEKKDRTGTGTISVFGRQIRHKMSEGFPLLTTKKMAWKTMVTELLWFLRGDTNIKYLVDNGCHIWDGDAYKAYLKGWEHANKLQKSFSTEERYQEYLSEIKILSQEEFINKIKTDDEFAKKWGDLGPIYGRQWRSWVNHDLEIPNGNGLRYMEKQTIDQIANSINLLKIDPDSRRNKVNAWNVGELQKMTLPPCHTDFQFYTRELSIEERVSIFNQKREKGEIVVPEFKSVGDVNAWTNKLLDNNLPTRAISLMYNTRSQDVPLGTPFNIASYALLLEIIAKEVNMVPDELIANMGDCHIYLNQKEGVVEQLTREPYPLPKLKILDSKVDDIAHYEIGDFIIEGYQSHPAIKMPLSN